MLITSWLRNLVYNIMVSTTIRVPAPLPTCCWFATWTNVEIVGLACLAVLKGSIFYKKKIKRELISNHNSLKMIILNRIKACICESFCSCLACSSCYTPRDFWLFLDSLALQSQVVLSVNATWFTYAGKES